MTCKNSELHLGSANLCFFIAASNVIADTFMGKIKIRSEKALEDSVQANGDAVPIKEVSPSPFLLLSLDLPPKPLFKNTSERNTLQQFALHTLLAKFNGSTQSHIVKTGELRSYTIEKLPKYLVLHVKRFNKNNFFLEKNPAVVHFPTNLDMSEYVSPDKRNSNPSYYKLVGAVTHEGAVKEGFYKAGVFHRAANQWFEIQDLVVKDTFPQLLTLAEAHLMVYEAQS
mmetsp:Transcript_14786/g.37727  ORF Transcript_14786/g.37727 Transcript_14786/m.37727 type:complete len:227 (+) Transcript_14786:806-1486(+)